jgi:hypothetical protein
MRLASISAGAPNRFVLGDLRQDLRYAARIIRKEPAFAAAAIVTLALDINAVLISPLPYCDSDALVSIVDTVDGREEAYFGDQNISRASRAARRASPRTRWSASRRPLVRASDRVRGRACPLMLRLRPSS